MNKTPFSKKVEILGDFYADVCEDESVMSSQLMQDHRDTFYLCLAAVTKWATLSEERVSWFVEDAWKDFCDYVHVDQGGEYQDYKSFMQIASSISHQQAPEELLIAQDPKTAPKILEELWYKHYAGPSKSEICDAVACNPNLSESMMRTICDFDTERDGDTMKGNVSSVLLNPNCPSELLSAYSEIYFDDWIMDIIFEHPNTPEEVIEEYVNHFGY